MKVFSSAGNRRNTGSVLMITLIVALLLGLSLTSYLLLVRAQSVAVARSQAWHAAITAAEAGVEEALAQLNAVPFATNIVFASAWRQEPGGYRLDQPRHLATSFPLTTNWYSVQIKSSTPPGAAVTIYATGGATVPSISATLFRGLEVKAMSAPLFAVTAVTRGEINMNGKNISTDSFDSTDPYRSTNGKYDPTKILGPRDWHGDVASSLGIRNAGTLDVHGQLVLGVTATNKNSFGFDVSGGISRDFNAEVLDMPVPFPPGSGRVPSGGSVGFTNYTYILRRDRDYELSSLTGSLFVTNDADAVLYVAGNATISSLVLAPKASLKIFVGGGNATFGSVVTSGTATNLQFFGLRGNTNVTLPGTGNFLGTIYAPNARLTASGASNNTLDFQGALVVNSLDLHTHLKLHFDENLKKNSATIPSRGYVVTSWKEVP